VGSVPDSGAEEEWAVVARLGKPRGNRGEIWAIPLSDRPDRYRSLGEVYLFGPDGPVAGQARLEVENAWVHQGRLILKFRGCDSISDAERLAGAEVRIPLRDRPAPPPGEFYHSDLAGCQVVERSTGAMLGNVTGVQETGGVSLLEVQAAESGKEILIPFAHSICVEIDVKTKRIVVELPEGLKEL
jgi:16S rRNA processing protein RimM